MVVINYGSGWSMDVVINYGCGWRMDVVINYGCGWRMDVVINYGSGRRMDVVNQFLDIAPVSPAPQTTTSQSVSASRLGLSESHPGTQRLCV